MENKKPWAWVPTLYFAEGVPYYLVTSISIVLFNQLGMSNGKMALFTSLITFPWIIKPLWSPFVDVIRTKRWWIVLMQALMAIAILFLAWLAPQGHFTLALIFFAITALASATHDIAADGYYMLALDAKQQASFVGLRSTFYRIAYIFCQSIILMRVGWIQRHTSVPIAWTIVLVGCSLLMAIIALWHHWKLPRVETLSAQPVQHKSIWYDIWQTFCAFFRKPGIVLALAFMLIYRLPEALLLKINNPFFLASQETGGLGLTVDQLGQISFVGILLMLLGGIVGGVWASRRGLKRTMLPMALCLTLPSAVYIYMAMCQPTSFWIIAACIGIEQLGYGLGYTACMLYMIHIADGAHKTAHYSFCTAFMFLGLMLPGTIAGYIQEATGYIGFFWIVMLCCIPSILISCVVAAKLKF